MGLFRKKCEYCREKVEKGMEVSRHVKNPAFTGTVKKAFCCEGHADAYEKESKGKRCGKSCCG